MKGRTIAGRAGAREPDRGHGLGLDARGCLALLLWAAIAHPHVAFAQWLDLQVPAKIEETAANAQAGKRIYQTYCYYCHGKEGDGEGPVAEYLWPRPRDFTSGTYKLRTTLSGELPTDEDLFRTVTSGIPGTAMPEWGSLLSSRERWQVVYYIKTFAPLFEDPEFNAYQYVYEIGKRPRGGLAQIVEKGRQGYDKAECWNCHGGEGRGDGPSAPDLTDDWGFPIWATDLTSASDYKGGNGALAVFLRISTALNGTPMPSYGQTLTDEERWQVAYYVQSLQKEKESEGVTILARRLDGDLPADPNDPRWQELPATVLPLTGQATVPPRWQIPAVRTLTVRAAYNSQEIALRLAWNDRFEDNAAPSAELVRAEGWEADDTYPVVYPNGEWKRGVFNDAVEVQFPERVAPGPELPHFLYGSPSRPVLLWHWRADRQDAGGWTPVEQRRARGPGKMPEPKESSDPVVGLGAWRDGRWQLVLRRSLTSSGSEPNVQFTPGHYIPVAFHVWDGSNGEVGLKMATSSWYFVRLETPAPVTAYLYVLLGVLGTAGIEYGLVQWLRRQARRGTLGEYGFPLQSLSG